MKLKSYVYIITIFIILNAFLDVLLTLEGINRFGIESEGNESVKYLLMNNQLYIWILWKVVPSILLIISILIMEYYFEKKKIDYFNYVLLAILLPFAAILFKINLDWIFYIIP